MSNPVITTQLGVLTG
jgi:hypothetical protein